MKLAEAAWPEVEAFDIEGIVLIATGSLEQHAAHLPMLTDTLIVTAVAEALEKRLPEQILLLPTIWLGASTHHLKFPGSLSATFESYEATILASIESLQRHGFRKFYILNGHGGNTESNSIVARKVKAADDKVLIASTFYASGIEAEMATALVGPLKSMAHACEAETSLMLHLHPHLVKLDLAVPDGLAAEAPVRGAVYHFDQMTESGGIGTPQLARASTGKIIFDAAIEDLVVQLQNFGEPPLLVDRFSSDLPD